MEFIGKSAAPFNREFEIDKIVYKTNIYSTVLSEDTYANFINQNENKILACANYSQTFLKFERIGRLMEHGDDL